MILIRSIDASTAGKEHKHPFQELLYSGLYQKPLEHEKVDSLSLAFIHTHPTPGYEGPSAGLSLIGFPPAAIEKGDVSVANGTKMDGIVISRTTKKVFGSPSYLPTQHFTVHFYDTNRNVICLGAYPIN